MAELSVTALTDPILMNEGKSIPPLLSFIILGVALGATEGTLTRLAPDFDIVTECGPVRPERGQLGASR